MRLMLMILLVLVGIALIWVRVAPSEPSVWDLESSPHGVGDFVSKTGFEAGRNAEPGALAVLNRIILATPRTVVLAGEPEDGRITYITRSLMFGFPDYTTIWMAGQELHIHGRLRFGLSDFGVNRSRILGWLAKMPDTLVTREPGR